MSLFRYSALSTKVKAMNSRLLKMTQLREMSDLHSVPEVVAYLKRFPSYARVLEGQEENGLHRSAAEVLVKQTLYYDYNKLYRFADMKQRIFLDDYFVRYEVLCIKNVLRYLFDGRADVPQIDLNAYKAIFERHSELRPELLENIRSMDELITSLEGTIYGGVLKQVSKSTNAGLFDYETALDMFYFRHMWSDIGRYLDRKEREAVRRSFGMEIDLLNIRWIYRAYRYYHMSTADIYAMIIPYHYRLSVHQIKQMVEAGSEKNFLDAVNETGYGRAWKEEAQVKLEDICEHLLEQVHAGNLRKSPYTAACLDTYLFRKEQEVNRVIRVIECVRYGLPADKMKEYLG